MTVLVLPKCCNDFENVKQIFTSFQNTSDVILKNNRTGFDRKVSSAVNIHYEHSSRFSKKFFHDLLPRFLETVSGYFLHLPRSHKKGESEEKHIWIS